MLSSCLTAVEGSKGKDWNGQDWRGLEWNGQERSGQDWKGKDWILKGTEVMKNEKI